MNLRQLRYFNEVLAQGFNITAAAAALHTSQPGISKQLILLEREFGVDLLRRRGNRIVGLTDPGRRVAEIAKRMLLDADSLRHLGDEFRAQDAGRLVIGTTYVQARYVLPEVLKRFKTRYPHVQLAIRQENENRVPDMVSTGELDIGLSAEPVQPHGDLLVLPCYELSRSVIVPARHALLREKRLTLEKIARFPIITLDALFSGGRTVLEAFAEKGLPVEIAMSAIAADVIKSYVELGLGVAVMPSIVFIPDRDRHLRVIDASHLFKHTVVCVQLRRHHYLRREMSDFIQLVAPHWTPETIATASRATAPVQHPKLPRLTVARVP